MTILLVLAVSILSGIACYFISRAKHEKDAAGAIPAGILFGPLGILFVLFGWWT